MLGAVVKLCAEPPLWLVTGLRFTLPLGLLIAYFASGFARVAPRYAAGSLATCGVAFLAGPKLVPRLLRRRTLKFKDEKDEASSGCRYMAFLHAVSASALNTYIIMGTDTFDDSARNPSRVPLMLRRSKLSEGSLGMSLGYFFLDAVLVAHYMPAMGGVEMVTHHVAAFCSVAATLYCKESHMYTLALLATEWTTPFINFRWLLDKLEMKESALYKANGIGLLCSWVVFRIGLFGWFFKHLFDRRDQLRRAHEPVRTLLHTVPVLLSVLNLLWFEKIVRGVFRAFGRKRRPKSQGGAEHGSNPKAAAPLAPLDGRLAKQE